MKILALDTSTIMGSVALVDEETVVAEQMLNNKITHSEKLIPSIETVLKTAGTELSEIDGFGVGIGPGSFTGLRIGLGAVKGLAFTQKKPVVGISSLVSLAYNMTGCDTPVISLIDARRGEYYIGVYRFKDKELKTILNDTVMPPDELIDYVRSLDETVTFVGDGVEGLKELIDARLQGRAVIPPHSMIHQRASNIAWLAMNRIKSGKADDLAALTPNYVRKSDAEK